MMRHLEPPPEKVLKYVLLWKSGELELCSMQREKHGNVMKTEGPFSPFLAPFLLAKLDVIEC